MTRSTMPALSNRVTRSVSTALSHFPTHSFRMALSNGLTLLDFVWRSSIFTTCSSRLALFVLVAQTSPERRNVVRVPENADRVGQHRLLLENPHVHDMV